MREPERPGAGAPPLLLYGHHAVAAALANPARPCRRLLATDNALARLGALAAARPGLAVERVPPRAIDRLLPADAVHQGACLEAGPLPERDLEGALAGLPGAALLLALDQVEDPRNLGAILRGAAATGVAAVLLPRRGSAGLTGACAKAASGAVDLVPVVEVPNLAQAIDRLKEAGVWVIGLDGEAPLALEAAPAYARRCLVLGAEGKGLRRLTAERCDLLARLAIDPRMESLNVAVAAGIALYWLSRPAPAAPPG